MFQPQHIKKQPLELPILLLLLTNQTYLYVQLKDNGSGYAGWNQKVSYHALSRVRFKDVIYVIAPVTHTHLFCFFQAHICHLCSQQNKYSWYRVRPECLLAHNIREIQNAVIYVTCHLRYRNKILTCSWKIVAEYGIFLIWNCQIDVCDHAMGVLWLIYNSLPIEAGFYPGLFRGDFPLPEFPISLLRWSEIEEILSFMNAFLPESKKSPLTTLGVDKTLPICDT